MMTKKIETLKLTIRSAMAAIFYIIDSIDNSFHFIGILPNQYAPYLEFPTENRPHKGQELR